MEARRWWIAHAGLPLLLFVAAFGLLHVGGGDRALAGVLYDAAAGRWRLDLREPLSQALYDFERGLVMAAVLAGLAVLMAGFWHRGARRWRRPVAYLLLCFAATTGLVSLGKHATNVDCPRALLDYGGRYPATGLLEDRPDAWPRAQCFPAGHSSAGFAWVALYFTLARGWRPAGLGAGIALGLAFAATQWARGMHFPSHDVVSAALAWTIALGAYVAWYRRPPGEADAPAADRG
jgi:membrane-associated PAP2 superfamily phosphatase